jgi:hypothetical protein
MTNLGLVTVVPAIAAVLCAATPAAATEVSVPLPVNGCKLNVAVEVDVSPQSGNPVYVSGATAGVACP